MDLARLVGAKPPTIPAGGRAFVDLMPDHQWCVRVQRPGEEATSRCTRLSPFFALQTTAYAYLDWVTGAAATFSYPEGKA